MAKLVPDTSPEYNGEMEAFDRNSPGYYADLNARNQQLLNNEQYLKNQQENQGISVVDGKLCITYERED